MCSKCKEGRQEPESQLTPRQPWLEHVPCWGVSLENKMACYAARKSVQSCGVTVSSTVSPQRGRCTPPMGLGRPPINDFRESRSYLPRIMTLKLFMPSVGQEEIVYCCGKRFCKVQKACSELCEYLHAFTTGLRIRVVPGLSRYVILLCRFGSFPIFFKGVMTQRQQEDYLRALWTEVA